MPCWDLKNLRTLEPQIKLLVLLKKKVCSRLSFSPRFWGSNPQEMLKSHRKFKTKMCKIYLFTLKLFLLVYNIILTSYILRIEASFQRHIWINHNVVAKLSISCRKYHVMITHFCRDPQEATKRRTACSPLPKNWKWNPAMRLQFWFHVEVGVGGCIQYPVFYLVWFK